MENSIIKAHFKCKFSKASIIVYALLALSIVWIIPLNTDLKVYDNGNSIQYYKNLFKVELFYNYDYADKFKGHYFSFEIMFFVGIGVFVLMFIIAAIKLYTQDVAKECSIELTSEGINGRRKRFGSKADLRLPIEKISLKILSSYNISNESKFLSSDVIFNGSLNSSILDEAISMDCGSSSTNSIPKEKSTSTISYCFFREYPINALSKLS